MRIRQWISRAVGKGCKGCKRNENRMEKDEIEKLEQWKRGGRHGVESYAGNGIGRLKQGREGM